MVKDFDYVLTTEEMVNAIPSLCAPKEPVGEIDHLVPMAVANPDVIRDQCDDCGDFKSASNLLAGMRGGIHVITFCWDCRGSLRK